MGNYGKKIWANNNGKTIIMIHPEKITVKNIKHLKVEVKNCILFKVCIKTAIFCTFYYFIYFDFYKNIAYNITTFS